MNTVRRWGVVCILTTVVFLLFWSYSGFCWELTSVPRGVEWKQIKTDHFVIVYTEQHRNIAPKVAGMAESVYQDMSRFLEFESTSKTHVIITDHLDAVDQFNLNVARKPNDERVVLSLSDLAGAGAPSFDISSQQWVLLQFIYQYTYIIRHQMDTLFRTLAGVMFPDSGFSGWMDGGMALYMVKLLEGSPGRSPYFDMLLRTEFLAEGFDTLEEQAAAGAQEWPGDRGMILAGYSFLLYLSETYGPERIAELNRSQGEKTPRPVGGENAFKEIYGKNLEELQEEWHASLQKDYEAQVQIIKSRPLTPTTPLTDSGYFSGYATFSPDGEYMYYIEDSLSDKRALTQLRLRDKQKVRLTEGNFSGKFSVSPDGQRIYFCKAEMYKTFYYRSDLYMLDLETRKVTRLTKGARAFDPTISPDGTTLVYVITGTGNMNLMSMDLTKEQTSTLLASSTHLQIRYPAFSSDGTKLAVQILKPEGGQDIYIINSDGTNPAPLSVDDAVDSAPAWGPNDNYLFFNSDRSGVPNIFAYAFNEQRLYQVTNLLTGGFAPAVSHNGKQLLLSQYSAQGLNVHIAELDTGTWRVFPEMPPQTPPGPERFFNIPTSPETRYKALSSLWFPIFFPIMGADETSYQVGLYMFGDDVIRQHEYSLSLLYGLKSGRLAYELEYLYRRFYPKIGLFVYDRSEEYVGYYDNAPEEDQAYWERQQGGRFLLGFPLYRSRKSDLYLVPEYEFRKLSSLKTLDEPDVPPPDEGNLADATVRLFLKSYNKYRRSISPESGILTRVEYKRYDKNLGSDWNINAVLGDLNLYIPTLFARHVLALRAAGGLSDDDHLTQGLYQLGGYFFEVPSDVLRRPKYYLRGYGSKEFRGDTFVLGSAEYRLPLWYVENTSWNGMIYWNSIAGKLFVDSGYAWNEGVEDMDLKYSVGGALNFNVGYRYGRIPLGIGIGFAQGLDKDVGISQIFFDVGLRWE